MIAVAKQSAAKARRFSSRTSKANTLKAATISQIEVAQGLSHEIRNPLAGIKAALEVLKGTESLSPQGHEVLGEVGDEIEQIDRVLKQFIDFSICPKPQPETFSLDAMVESVFDQLRQKPAGFTVRVAAPVALQVSADISMVQRVLAELFQNGIDAGADLVTVDGRAEKGNVVIQVSNSGAPLEQEIADHIFEPFFSTKAGRTGLGLAIAQRWLAVMEGSLRLLPAGNGFEIRLPRGK
jgi:signal transduction histidine kinase